MAASSDDNAVAAPSAKPAMSHTGWRTVGRTPRSAISLSKRLEVAGFLLTPFRDTSLAAGELRRRTASWPA